jgi:hypothetical protein
MINSPNFKDADLPPLLFTPTGKDFELLLSEDSSVPTEAELATGGG